MKKHTIKLIALLLVIISCNDNGISTNSDGNKVYTYEPIGWQMELPEGWEVLSASQRDKLAYAAQNYYEEETQNSSKEGEKKIILGVRKAEKDMNACYAFIRSYNRDEDYPSLRDLLKQQYRSYSADFYSADTSLSEEVLNSITFEKAVLAVQYQGKPYFTYTTYSTMLDTVNFGVSIVSNNTNDEQMMIEAFRKSTTYIKR